MWFHDLGMDPHETPSSDLSTPTAGGRPGPLWDLARAEKLSDRHSPRPAGDYLSTTATMVDHLVGLIGPEVTGPPSVWIAFLDEDDRVLPVAVPVDDLPSFPDTETVANLSALVRAVLAENFPRARVLGAVVRADGGDYGAFERRWAGALWRAAEIDGWPVRAVVAVGEGRARVLSRERCL